jgi:hypothetical protein
MTQLNTENTVRAVFHYAKCTLVMDGKDSDYKPDAIGGKSIDVYDFFLLTAL